MKLISLLPALPPFVQLQINWLFIHCAGLLVYHTLWSCYVHGSQVNFLPAFGADAAPWQCFWYMSALSVWVMFIPRSPLLCMAAASTHSWLTALSIFTLFEDLILSCFCIPVTGVVVVGLMAKFHRGTIIQR